MVRRVQMENQVQLNAERVELLGKFRAAVPQFMAAEAEVSELAYKEGAFFVPVKKNAWLSKDSRPMQPTER